jgi:hypothetical protein
VLGVPGEVDGGHAATTELALDRVRRAKRGLQLLEIRCGQRRAPREGESATNLGAGAGYRQHAHDLP